MTKNTSKTNNLAIHITNVKKEKRDGLQFSELSFIMSGKDINPIIANTLRRISYDNVTTYAFPSNCITIEKNTSIYNNDRMVLRLSNMPLYDIKNDVIFLHPKYWNGIDYSDQNRLKHPNEKSIEIYFHYDNKTDFNANVTTNDAIIMVEGNEVSNFYSKEYPIKIIDLRPGESFHCKMRAVLGVGDNTNIWAAANLAYYSLIDKDNIHNIKFDIESNGQLTEAEILVNGCKIVEIKLNGIRDEIRDRIKNGSIQRNKKIIFELEGEDHTMGQLITNALQDHKDIIFCGGGKPDHLVKIFKIKMCCSNNVESPIEAFFDTIDYLKDVFAYLQKEFEKLD